MIKIMSKIDFKILWKKEQYYKNMMIKKLKKKVNFYIYNTY
jgi:hypothetical protein